MERILEAFFLLSTMLILCAISIRVYKKYLNIVSIMVFPWCFLCGLISLGLYGAYEIQMNTVLIVCFSCFAYSIPCFVLQNKKNNGAVQFTAPYPLKTKILLWVNLFAIILCIYISKDMWTIIFTQGFTQARYYFLRASEDSTIYSTGQIYVLYVCFAIFIATILTAVHSLLSKAYNKVAIVLSIIDLLLYVMAIAGRMTIFRLLFYLIIGFMFKAGKLKLRRKEKILIVAICLFLIYITSMRRVVNSNSIIQDIFFYFAGSFGYLNQIVMNPHLFITAPSRLYGRITFGFLTQPLEMILYLIGFKDIVFSDVPISNVTGAYYPVAPGISQNHSCTAAFYFFSDFGILGILIGFFVLAVISVYIFKKSCNTGNNVIFWQCMLLYISYIIFFTIWEYQLMSWSVLVTVFFLYLFTANKPFLRINNRKLKLNS